MSLRKNQFGQKANQPAEPVVKKKKEKTPRYTIIDDNDSLKLSLNAEEYQKNPADLQKDIEIIVQEFRDKIADKHTSIHINLFLNGLSVEDQFALQKELIAIIKDTLLHKNPPLTKLYLHGWDIIGPVEEMKLNLVTTKIQDQKEHLLRSLGVVLAKNTSLTTLSLDNGNFNSNHLGTFFVNLDERTNIKNTSTALKHLSLVGSDIRPPQLNELKKIAAAHQIELNLTAPKKTTLSDEARNQASKAKKNTKGKNKDLATLTSLKQRPERVLSQDELDQKDIDAHLASLPDMEDLPEVEDVDIITPAPVVAEPPTRSWLKLGLYLLAGLAGGVVFGLPIGGIVAGLSVLAEIFVGNAPLVTILGIGLSASGIGLAFGVAIAAGIIIAAIAYGIYSAEKDHQSSVANHNNAQPTDASVTLSAPSDKPASTHSLANTTLQDPSIPAASTTEPNDDALLNPNPKKPKSESSLPNVSGLFHPNPKKPEEVVTIMDEVIPSAAPSLGKKLDE